MATQKERPERANYHCHCSRCGHAQGAPADYAEEAIRQRLVRLGFSDHLPYRQGGASGYQMPFSQLEPYLDELTSLRYALRGTLEIYRGFEAEYFPDQRDYYEELLARNDCDYLLLGQHFFTSDEGERISTFDTPDTRLYEAYARSVVTAMQTGLYRYAAHPDLIFLNGHPWDDHCERACDIILDGAVRLGFPLECNANGFRRGLVDFPDGRRYPYPAERFWDKAAGAGITVYVGSDCHQPEQMWDDAVEQCFSLLRARGIEPKADWPIG